MKLYRILNLSLMLLLTGCMGNLPWPDAPLKESSKANSNLSVRCPVVSGVYANSTLSSGICKGVDTVACSSLAFYLLSNHVPEAEGVSNYPTPTDDWPAGAIYVVLEQPSDDIIRVTARDLTGSSIEVRELRQRDGDFRCDADAIHLKPRVQSDFVAMLMDVRRRNNLDYRTIRVAEDASLSVTSNRNYSSYFWGFVGGTVREETRTLRWPKALLP
jgi:hypothetical protein